MLLKSQVATTNSRLVRHLKNSADSNMIHSVDFHAATGPGGGGAALQVDSGKEKSMTFKALIRGLYVYQRQDIDWRSRLLSQDDAYRP